MERNKALELALSQIEKQFGQGAVMKLGADQQVKVGAIPTGALSLDLALGIGGLPRGRVVEIYGPESSGKSSLALHAVAEAQKLGGIAAFIDAEHALDPVYARAIGVDVDELLVSQPDTGEQALEIADMLVRSGAVDILVIDSVAALVPRAELEGEMGDTHVGLQARLMSQALRKLTGSLSRSKTCCVFINQLREKVGVMFGCMSYSTRVTLADGTQEKIGKIVDNKLPVEVLSYDWETGEIVPRKVVNWFDNGPTDHFLRFTVARGDRNGRARFACTPNHQVMTTRGWREAQELCPGDRVIQSVPHHLSELQWEVVLGGLMGASALSPTRSGYGARLQWGHGGRQATYGDWKASLFGNLDVTRRTNDKGAVVHEVEPLPELAELCRAVYSEAEKVLSHDHLKRLTPLSLAIWYMDAATFAACSEGSQRRIRGGTPRAELCVEAMEATSRIRLKECLADTWGIRAELLDRAGTAVLRLSTAGTDKLQRLIAPYVHPSMEYKLRPRHRGQFCVEPSYAPKRYEPVPMPILSIDRRPAEGRATHRFDIEVEGGHNYFVDGVMVHNSPETTPGGRALKFYSSVRLDVRRIESLKDGQDFVGNRVRAKVVKNKCLAAGTKVFDPSTGVTHTIDEVVDGGEGTSVWAADKKGRLNVRAIEARMNQGEQEVIGLVLQDGNTLKVTPDHRVLTDRGWRQAGSLKPGDYVARPRRAGTFGDAEPISPDQARLLGYVIGEGDVGGRTAIGGENDEVVELARWAGIWGEQAAERKIPAALFAADVSGEVVANLVSGIWESDGWMSREQSGELHLGVTTTSEQLAWQLHWLLLYWGIASTVAAGRPGNNPSDVAGRGITGKLPCWQLTVSGIDDVERFADVIPMWGPKGEKLTSELANPTLGRHHGSRRSCLPESRTEPILDYLRTSGVTAELAASLLGLTAEHARGGMEQVLGAPRLRRNRVTRLAEALDSAFLRDLLDEDVDYDRIREVTGPEWQATYDLEIEEDHTFVADGVVVHNCAAPFRLAEFDLLYGEGISREGSILDVGVEAGIIKKSGAWYQYDGEQIGQGRENARQFLKEHDDVARAIEKKAKEALGIVTPPPAEAAGDEA